MWLLFLLLVTVGVNAAEYSQETAGWTLSAQENAGDGILLQFELSDYQLLRTDTGVTVEIPGLMATSGDPLPLISTWLELPANAPVSLELLSAVTVEMPDCAPVPLLSGSDRWDTDNGSRPAETNFHTALWPQAAKMTTPAIMRDRRLTQISIAPFRLATDGHTLLRTDRLELFVSFNGEDCNNCDQLISAHPSRVAELQFSKLLLNYRPAWQSTRDITRGGYVIFFPELAREYLYPLISWKRQLGWAIDTVCTTTDDMDHNDIQDYLQTRWDLGNSFDFVLLVGDKDVYDQAIPMDAFFINGTSYSEPQWNGQDATDHPYSMLAGNDFLPEVYVGRLSVDTAGQLQAVVNKILRYERDIILPEDDPNWPDRALMICDWWLAWSRREVMRQVRDDLLAHGYTTVDSAYSHYYNPLPASSIYPAVNDGLSYVNYRGFGHRYAWVTPFFTSDDIQNSVHNNDKLPVITSIVCGGGDFASYGSDPCFGEKWLRHGTANLLKGAVGFIGPTELDTHTRWNNTIDLGIYQGVIQERLEYLGQLLTRGKLELYLNNPDWLSPGGPSNSVHFYFHTYNLLGDPGLILITGTPVTPEVHYPVLIPVAQSQVAVQVLLPNEESLANVTLYDELTDETFSVWTNESGLALVDIPTGVERTWILTVSGYGLIPVQNSIMQSDWQLTPLLISLEDEQGGELVVGESQQVRLRAVNRSSGILTPVAVSLTANGMTFGADFQMPGIAVGEEALSENSVELSYSDLSLVLEQQLFTGVFAGGDPGAFNQLLHGPRLTVDSLLWSDDNDDLPQRGETGTVEIFLRNSGDRGFEQSSTVLLQLSSCLFSSTTQFDLPPLSPDAATSCVCQLSINQECVNGAICPILLVMTGELPWTAVSSLTIGELDWTDPAGPDAGGYYAYHSNDDYELAPEFDWLELDPDQGGPGSSLNIYDSWQPGSDDPYGETNELELPFTFRFYGQDYTTISVCSNGWLAPGYTNLTSWRNSHIPGANGPPGMVAPFWDDLYNYQYQQLGDIFYWYDSDGGRYYVEWSEFRIAGASPVMSQNFQVVIHDQQQYPTRTGDSELIFHYLDYQNLHSQENYATIGIEAPSEQQGLEYSFNNDYNLPNQQLNSQQSIRFTTGILLQGVAGEPDVIQLVRGYPNPFNSNYSLQFTLDRNSDVEVAIYNLLGEKIALLHQGLLNAGPQLLQWQADSAPSGLYFYSITVNNTPSLTGKCLLIR
jgi:hypothetical protein